MLEWPGGHFMGLFEDQDSLYLYARIFKMQAAIIQVSDEHEHWEGIVDRTDWTIFVISPGVGQSIGPRKLSTFLSFRTGSNSHGASEFEDLATRSKPKALPPFDI
jgi:hypothetical protein